MKKKRCGEYALYVAEKNGLKTRKGKGDHAVIIAPAGRGYMTVTVGKEIGKGLWCKIEKWFAGLGITLGILGIAYFGNQLFIFLKG